MKETREEWTLLSDEYGDRGLDQAIDTLLVDLGAERTPTRHGTDYWFTTSDGRTVEVDSERLRELRTRLDAGSDGYRIHPDALLTFLTNQRAHRGIGESPIDRAVSELRASEIADRVDMPTAQERRSRNADRALQLTITDIGALQLHIARRGVRERPRSWRLQQLADEASPLYSPLIPMQQAHQIPAIAEALSFEIIGTPAIAGQFRSMLQQLRARRPTGTTYQLDAEASVEALGSDEDLVLRPISEPLREFPQVVFKPAKKARSGWPAVKQKLHFGNTKWGDDGWLQRRLGGAIHEPPIRAADKNKNDRGIG